MNVVSQLYAPADSHARIQLHALANLSARFHADVRPDHGTGRKLRAGMDKRRGMHAGFDRRRREVDESLRHTREISVRIRCDDKVTPFRRRHFLQVRWRNQHRTGLRAFHLRQIFLVREKGELRGAGFVERREAVHAMRCIACYVSAEALCQFTKRDRDV